MGANAGGGAAGAVGGGGGGGGHGGDAELGGGRKGVGKQSKPPRKRHQRALNNCKERLAKISTKSVVVMQLSEAYTAENSFLVNENVRIRRENELLKKQIAILSDHQDGNPATMIGAGGAVEEMPVDSNGAYMGNVENMVAHMNGANPMNPSTRGGQVGEEVDVNPQYSVLDPNNQVTTQNYNQL